MKTETKKALVQRAKNWIEFGVLLAAIMSGFWYKIVKPKIQEIIREEVEFSYILLFEMATEEQYQNALKKLKDARETGIYMPGMKDVKDVRE